MKLPWAEKIRNIIAKSKDGNNAVCQILEYCNDEEQALEQRWCSDKWIAQEQHKRIIKQYEG